MREKLAPNFFLDEFLRSDIATRHRLDNAPGYQSRKNIITLLAPGMQRVRDLLGAPVIITSGYRSAVVNKLVGGSQHSQHLRGLAADFISPNHPPATVAQILAKERSAVGFDQLILEGHWVHVSFCEGEPRGQVLTARFEPDGVRYEKGLP